MPKRIRTKVLWRGWIVVREQGPEVVGVDVRVVVGFDEKVAAVTKVVVHVQPGQPGIWDQSS
jgi:hypothetical protein